MVHFLHTMTYGGVETAILNWCKGLSRDSFDVHLVCFANPGETEWPFVEAAERAGFTVHRIRWSRRKPILRAARELARYLSERSIDIVHCHNTYAEIVGLAAARLVRVKTVTTFYVWGKFGWKRGVLQWIDAKLMRFFDQVTAHCESCFRDTVARGISADRLKLLICGYPVKQTVLSADERNALRAEFGAGPGDLVLLYLARFWPEKAHDSLLQAMALAIAKAPQLQLWLAGTGAEQARIEQLSQDMGLEDHVRFLGFRSDAAALLAAADIQVHPSDNEGVSLAICEGMVAGKPIIATRVGGLPEVLRDRVSAILIEPRRPQELAAAILELAGDAEERERLGCGARRFITEEYSLEVATARVEALYRDLVQT